MPEPCLHKFVYFVDLVVFANIFLVFLVGFLERLLLLGFLFLLEVVVINDIFGVFLLHFQKKPIKDII